jgi:hypothetical protein
MRREMAETQKRIREELTPEQRVRFEELMKQSRPTGQRKADETKQPERRPRDQRDLRRPIHRATRLLARPKNRDRIGTLRRTSTWRRQRLFYSNRQRRNRSALPITTRSDCHRSRTCARDS